MIRFGERAASRRDAPGSKSVSSSAFRAEQLLAGAVWTGTRHEDASSVGLSKTAELDKQKREQKQTAGVKPIQLGVNEARKLDFDNLNIRKQSVESQEDHANAVLHRINSKLDHILKRNEILEKSGLFSIKENEEKRRRPSLNRAANESTPRIKDNPSISKPPPVPKEILRPVWVSFGSRSRSKLSLNSKGSKDSKDSKDDGSAKDSGKQLLEDIPQANNSSLCLSKKSGYRIRYRNSSSKPDKDMSTSQVYQGHRDLTKSMISEDLSVISHDLSMKKTDGNFSILKLLDNSRHKLHTREKRRPESRRLFEGKENHERPNETRKPPQRRDMQVEYLDLHLQKQPQEGIIESKSIIEFVQVDKKHDSLKRDFFDRAKKQPRTGEVKTFQLADETDRKALHKAGSNSQALDLSGYGSSLVKGLAHRTNQHVQVSVFEPRDSSNNSARNNFFREASAKYPKNKQRLQPASTEDPTLRSGDRSGHFGSSLPEERSEMPDRLVGKPVVSRSANKVAELQRKLDVEINTKLKISHVLKLAMQKFSLSDAISRPIDSLSTTSPKLLADKEISLQHRFIALLKKNKKSAVKIVFLLMSRKLRDRKKEGLRKIYERSLRKRR